MKRREVYATSGPRINLDFEAGTTALTCEKKGGEAQVSMGGELTSGVPNFRLAVVGDRVPLQKIEVIKGRLEDGIFRESVTTLWDGSAKAQCVVWQDAEFMPGEPAFWYVRVKEQETPRWTAHQCRKENRCDEFPGADVMVQERAWSSPIWYLPSAS